MGGGGPFELRHRDNTHTHAGGTLKRKSFNSFCDKDKTECNNICQKEALGAVPNLEIYITGAL